MTNDETRMPNQTTMTNAKGAASCRARAKQGVEYPVHGTLEYGVLGEVIIEP